MIEDKKYCECCGQPIVNYKVTLTYRNLVWLFSLAYLGKHKTIKSSPNDYSINYKEVHDFVATNFKGMVVSSYATMGLYPWELITKTSSTSEKFKSNGEWELTSKGIKFLNGLISVPETLYFNWEGCYKVKGNVSANQLKKVNFQELVERFKSF